MQKVPFGKLGFEVSRLGFGMMRLPTMENDQGEHVIDRDQAIKMVRTAIDHGVSYVDTAYGYHGGESEIVTGLALKDGYREKVKLVTKLPTWRVNEAKDMDRLLDEQLKKLDVPYLDFYLLHALRRESFEKMQSFNYVEFLNRARRDGRIRHAGFSFHDDKDAFIDILNDFDWELAQVQINYLDDEAQATAEGIRYAGRKGVPVVAMEPLRGGALASPPQEIKDTIQAHPRGYSPVEWAFRYVGNYPEIVTILSGMSTMEQVEDNLRIFQNVTVGNLSPEDEKFVAELKKAYMARIAVGCTHCDYCQPCPQNVLIPRIFEIYNRAYMFDNNAQLVRDYKNVIKDEGDSARCVACGQCEAACPQQLEIIKLLDKIHQEATK
jgi:predicted aldo/keto reductase-like oxidoreductase